MYQILNNLSPEITKDIFETKINCYNTLNVLIFSKTHVKTDTDYRPCHTLVRRFGSLFPKRFSKLLL